jgi:hypothetical protein
MGPEATMAGQKNISPDIPNPMPVIKESIKPHGSHQHKQTIIPRIHVLKKENVQA